MSDNNQVILTTIHANDRDCVCTVCGFDGAEWYWWKNNTYEGRADEETKMPECKPHDIKINETLRELDYDYGYDDDYDDDYDYDYYDDY